MDCLQHLIGKLCFNRRDTLGSKGNFGTTFRGTFEGTTDVAIKRLEMKDFDVDLKAIREGHLHSNVLHYFCNEKDIEFMYIAFELTAGTLKDLVRDKYSGPPVGDWRIVLKQITSGLDHLHKKQVIHCHLKPSNILVSFPDGGVPPLMKLANFGIVNRISLQDGNTASLWKLGGSKGWLPAEAYIQSQFTAEMDFYALGLVYGYSLSKGCHPFGEDKDERIIKMKKSKPMTLTANQLQNVTDPEKIFHLITRMLSLVPKARPSASDVLKDAFFNPVAAAARDLVFPQPPELEIVPTTSRKVKQEIVDEVVVIHGPMQAKRTKRNVSSVLPDCITVKEEPATAADVEENISEPRQSTSNLQTQDSDTVEISELEQRIVNGEFPLFLRTYDDDADDAIDSENIGYLLLADFERTEDYSSYVREHIQNGMRVRCCQNVEGLGLIVGDSGTVVVVNVSMDRIKVEWDTLATSYWVEYKQVEILDDKAASFGSEYMERDFESDEKESDTEALENPETEETEG